MIVGIPRENKFLPHLKPGGNILPASEGCKEIEVSWKNVEDDNVSDQNVKNSRINVIILII